MTASLAEQPLPSTGQAATSVPSDVAKVGFEGRGTEHSRRLLAVETAVNVVYGTVPYAVMMMTPADLEDFAVGFSLTEGVIQARSEIRGIRVEDDPDGLRLVVNLAPERFHALLARRRSMSGRTSCGVCGIEDLAAVPRTPQRTTGLARLSTAAVRRALDALPGLQGLNQETGAVHAAAWVDLSGGITYLREDVGRHNALDKLVGAVLTRGVDPAAGFLLVTSRCSYEMVEKAAALGASALVAISAPTSLGVERARHHGITLVGVARGDAMTVFTGAEQVEP
ncbi:MAG: formate dehydrogenase accessory sulfurtransferase FdhD [Janthinobacterium lividum]